MEQSTGSQELYQHLRTYGRAKIDGWAINANGMEIWLIDPYSIDVGSYTNNTEGCAGILERISTDDHKGE